MSKFLEAQAPATALALYPVDGEARLRLVLDELEAGDADYAALTRKALDGLVASVGDARFYSLLGALAQRAGNLDQAARLFDQALILSKAEQYALVQIVNLRARTGAYAAAVEHADVLMRRWGERYPEISAAMSAMFRTRDGYRAIMSRLGDAPPWRRGFLAGIADEPGSAALLRKAVMDLRDARAPPTGEEINLALDALYRRNDVADAFRLFLFTLTNDERRLAGLVFDSRFLAPPSGKRFDWRVADTKGVETTMPIGGGGARLQFEEQPVTGVAFGQTLALFPGHYRLATELDARGLALPGGLFLSARCASTGAPLARLDVPEGSYDQRLLAAEFDVPGTGCEAQDLALGIDRAQSSWNMRYKGALILRSISVDRPSQ